MTKKMATENVTTEANTLPNRKILLCGNTFCLKISPKTKKIQEKWPKNHKNRLKWSKNGLKSMKIGSKTMNLRILDNNRRSKKPLPMIYIRK